MTRLDRLGSNTIQGDVIGTRDDEVVATEADIGALWAGPDSVDNGGTFSATIYTAALGSNTSLVLQVEVYTSGGTGTVEVSTTDTDGWTQTTPWSGTTFSKTATFTLASATDLYSELTFDITPLAVGSVELQFTDFTSNETSASYLVGDSVTINPV